MGLGTRRSREGTNSIVSFALSTSPTPSPIKRKLQQRELSSWEIVPTGSSESPVGIFS